MLIVTGCLKVDNDSCPAQLMLEVGMMWRPLVQAAAQSKGLWTKSVCVSSSHSGARIWK